MPPTQPPPDQPDEQELMRRLGIDRLKDLAQQKVCDFCEQPRAFAPPVVAYPVTNFKLPIGELPVTVELPGLNDAWVACARCDEFIDTSDYSGLARRMGYPPGPLPPSLEMFRDARLGPGQRLTD